MRPPLLTAIFLAAACLFESPSHAETADRARLLCQENNDLARCDEMIAKTDPNNPAELTYAYVTRALMRISNADLDGAIADVRKALSLSPKSPQLQKLQTKLAAIAGPQQDLSMRCLLDLEPAEQRIDVCNRLIDSGSGTQDVELFYRASRAATLFDSGRVAEARADLQVALTAQPQESTFIELDISFDFANGDYQTALKKAEQAMSTQKQPPMSLALLPGQLAYLLGYHSMAIQKMTAAIHADPYDRSPGYWISLARQEDHEDADLDFQRMVDIGGPRSFSGKVGLFMLGKLPPQALIDAVSALPDRIQKPRLCLAYFTIGHKAWMSGDKAAAKQAFQQALATNQYRQISYQMSKVLLGKLGQ